MRSTFRPEVIGDIGGFGGLFALDGSATTTRCSCSSTDGVGTKSLDRPARPAATTRSASTVVAMSVDDIAAQGAEPLFFLDYISIGKLVPEDDRRDRRRASPKDAAQAGCALLGGEMSEHPGVMEPGEFDLVGFAVGVVERAEVLPRDVRAGDRDRRLREPGPALQRLLARARRAARPAPGAISTSPAWPGASHSLADELLVPSVIYAPAMLELATPGRRARVRAHHRRRHPRQPRSRPPRPLRRGRAPRRVGASRGSSPRSSAPAT